jgi:hypothetical protein
MVDEYVLQALINWDGQDVLKLAFTKWPLTFHGITVSVCLQVILMVGLPGSGKTQWALKYAKENPEKRYNVLGAETVLNQMRVSCWGQLASYSICSGGYQETLIFSVES